MRAVTQWTTTQSVQSFLGCLRCRARQRSTGALYSWRDTRPLSMSETERQVQYFEGCSRPLILWRSSKKSTESKSSGTDAFAPISNLSVQATSVLRCCDFTSTEKCSAGQQCNDQTGWQTADRMCVLSSPPRRGMEGRAVLSAPD